MDVIRGCGGIEHLATTFAVEEVVGRFAGALVSSWFSWEFDWLEPAFLVECFEVAVNSSDA